MRLVEHPGRSGFVAMKRPPIGGSAPPYRGKALVSPPATAIPSREELGIGKWNAALNPPTGRSRAWLGAQVRGHILGRGRYDR
jgi:hypothetical protein